MQIVDDRLGAGARNMLVACGGARAGERVLVCHEPADEGYYDSPIVAAVTREAAALGLHVTPVEVPFDPVARAMPDDLAEAMTRADLTVFLARIGDQLRFNSMPAGTRALISYALDAPALASAFGTLPHSAMKALKDALDDAVSSARDIRVTCPAGTDFSGRPAAMQAEGGEVSLSRFPMLVIKPILAAGFSGRVALPGFLTGSGSMYYDPYSCFFDGPVHALLDAGRLMGFEGAEADVAAAGAHYDRVSGLFGLDRDAVHSWHVGMHPGCAFPHPAQDDLTRWGGSAFGNPRILHFHTCGAFAPGTISWNVLDPTVELDGQAVWQGGRLVAERIPGGPEILARYPELAAALAQPDRRVGL